MIIRMEKVVKHIGDRTVPLGENYTYHYFQSVLLCLQPSDEVLETLEDGIVMDPPDGCPDNIYDIMCHCWEIEPHERPDFVRLRELLARSFGECMV